MLIFVNTVTEVKENKEALLEIVNIFEKMSATFIEKQTNFTDFCRIRKYG